MKPFRSRIGVQRVSFNAYSRDQLKAILVGCPVVGEGSRDDVSVLDGDGTSSQEMRTKSLIGTASLVHVAKQAKSTWKPNEAHR